MTEKIPKQEIKQNLKWQKGLPKNNGWKKISGLMQQLTEEMENVLIEKENKECLPKD